MGGAVRWSQLSAQDGEQLVRFYEAFLDWNVREARLTSTEAGVSGTFRVVETGGLSGNIATDDPGRGVVLFVEVDDLGAALERARELGIDKTWREDFDIQELGDAGGLYQVAWMEDPAGNRLELFQNGAGYEGATGVRALPPKGRTLNQAARTPIRAPPPSVPGQNGCDDGIGISDEDSD